METHYLLPQLFLGVLKTEYVPINQPQPSKTPTIHHNHNQPSTTTEVKAKAPPTSWPNNLRKRSEQSPNLPPSNSKPPLMRPQVDVEASRPQTEIVSAPKGDRNETQGFFVPWNLCFFFPKKLCTTSSTSALKITMEPWRNCSFGDKFEPFWKSCWFWFHLSFGGKEKKGFTIFVDLVNLVGTKGEKMSLWIIQGW